MDATPRQRLRAGLPYVVVAAIGTAAGLAVGINEGRTNWPVYAVVTVVGAAGAAIVHARHGLSRLTLTGLVVFALGHVAGGMLPVGDGFLYSQWIVEPVVRYDNLQHAIGFGVVGMAGWEVLRHRLEPVPDPVVTWWVVVATAMAVGSVNEVIEWILTLTIPGTDVGGYDNTARDLVANMVGGIVAGTWVAWRRVVAPSRRRGIAATDDAGPGHRTM